jgi:nucleotide-binding universal stress UspA family protein
MSYASIMVHVDVVGRSDDRVALAARLAERFAGRLIGIAGWAPRPLFVSGGIPVDPAPTERQLRDMQAVLDETGQKFRAAAGGSSTGVEWRCGLDFPTDLVTREARAADLLVIGRDWTPLDPYSSLDPGGLILRAGRPVLVVPSEITALSGRNVMVAWKDTREARRAVRDALPFLREAHTVLLIEVVDAGNEQQAFQRLKDVRRFLAAHRITAISERVRAAGVTAADTLLAAVEEARIDLIVCGAYGHSRLGEWFFGGVTRDLLKAAPVCCLFSH